MGQVVLLLCSSPLLSLITCVMQLSVCHKVLLLVGCHSELQTEFKYWCWELIVAMAGTKRASSASGASAGPAAKVARPSKAFGAAAAKPSQAPRALEEQCFNQ